MGRITSSAITSSLLKGNHLLQFGGQFQHNYDYHQRSDNGGGINFTPTYQLGDSAGAGLVDMSDLRRRLPDQQELQPRGGSGLGHRDRLRRWPTPAAAALWR